MVMVPPISGQATTAVQGTISRRGSRGSQIRAPQLGGCMPFGPPRLPQPCKLPSVLRPPSALAHLRKGKARPPKLEPPPVQPTSRSGVSPSMALRGGVEGACTRGKQVSKAGGGRDGG